MFFQPASNYLVIPHHVVDRERNILLRLERDDFLQLLVLEGWQFNKTRKNRLRGQGAIHSAIFDAQLMHHFAQHDGRFMQCSMGLPTLASRRIERRFSQTIVQQHEATVRLDTELCQAKGLGPKIKTDQARCDSHVQIPNSNRGQISSSKSRTRQTS